MDLALKSKGSFAIFFTRPISAICLFLAIALLAIPFLPWVRRPGAVLEHEEST